MPFHDCLGFLGMHHVVRAHSRRKRQPRLVYVGCDDPRCTGGLADANREQADRTASGDQHCCAGDLRAPRGMACVTHWIVNAADIVRNVVIEMPDVRRRHRDVLGEAPVTVHANDLRVRAYMSISGSTQHAAAVDDVALRGHAVTFADVGDERSDLNDVAGGLMPDDEWWNAAVLRPRVPVVDVDVGTTDTSASHVDEDLVLTNRRLRDVLQLESGSGGLLDQRFHAKSLRSL